jgi:hypothetical protein
MRNKRGLSVVIATLLMVILVISATAIIFTVFRNMIEDETGQAEDCYNVEFGEKVMINDDYTCHNSTDNSLLISISLADEEIDTLLIAVESAGSSRSFELSASSKDFPTLVNYPSNTTGIVLPGKNSGKTYVLYGVPDSPEEIRIAPGVGEYQCRVTDTVTQIEDCSVFVGL